MAINAIATYSSYLTQLCFFLSLWLISFWFYFQCMVAFISNMFEYIGMVHQMYIQDNNILFDTNTICLYLIGEPPRVRSLFFGLNHYWFTPTTPNKCNYSVFTEFKYIGSTTCYSRLWKYVSFPYQLSKTLCRCQKGRASWNTKSQSLQNGCLTLNKYTYS